MPRRIVPSSWATAWHLSLAFVVGFALFAPSAAWAERRVALVIGNSAYEHAPVLPNPRSDAEALAATLTGLGFEVDKGLDLNRAQTEQLVRSFSAKLRGAEVALLFYAGHGLQVAGRNYLLPIDAKLADETDLHFEATDLELLFQLMNREPRVNLIFLDACRDNPLAKNLARSMGASRSTAVGRGLAVADTSVGSFIAYATQPGNVALDGTGSHSPFATAILQHAPTPGLGLADLMVRVRNDVIAATDGKQVPWDHSSLTGSFYFVPAVATAPVAAGETPPPAATADKEIVYWESIKNSNNPANFDAYLAQYPQGTFAGLARVRLEELAATKVEPAAGGDEVAVVTPPTVDVSAEQTERDLGLTRNGRQRVQLALKFLGYDIGSADGMIGPMSRKALTAWQVDQGQTPTGYLTAPQHKSLLDQAAPLLAAWDAEKQRNAEAARLAAEEEARLAAIRKTSEPDDEATRTFTQEETTAEEAPEQTLTTAEPEPTPEQPQWEENLNNFFSIMDKSIPKVQ